MGFEPLEVLGGLQLVLVQVLEVFGAGLSWSWRSHRWRLVCLRRGSWRLSLRSASYSGKSAMQFSFLTTVAEIKTYLKL